MKLEIVFKDGRKEIFGGVASFNVVEEESVNEERHAPEMARTPTPGELFVVNPLGIDRSRFENRMRYQGHECVRQIIQEAFAEVDKNPERYAAPFYTLIPHKEWNGGRLGYQLDYIAEDLGGHTADWVEQAMEWAQRLSNGESWKDICDKIDKVKWCRLVRWKDGYYRLVGGKISAKVPSDVGNEKCYSNSLYFNAVPLVAFKKINKA